MGSTASIDSESRQFKKIKPESKESDFISNHLDSKESMQETGYKGSRKARNSKIIESSFAKSSGFRKSQAFSSDISEGLNASNGLSAKALNSQYGNIMIE